MYNEKLTGLLDRLLPERQFVRRPRPSDPWFDKACRQAKRLTRRLERAFAAASRRADTAYAASTTAVAASVVKAAAAKAAWYNQRRSYRQLRRLKCAEFWRDVSKVAILSVSKRSWSELNSLYIIQAMGPQEMQWIVMKIKCCCWF